MTHLLRKSGKIICLLLFFCVPCKAQIFNVDTPTFLAKIAQTPGAQILDLRTPEDYMRKHIPDAINIEPTQFDFLSDVKDQLGNSDTLFIYCRVGRPVGVDELLLQNGYKVVYNLKGGSLAWEEYEADLAKDKQRAKDHKKPKKRRVRQLYIGTC